MNRYHQERDHLLHEAGSCPYPGQRPSVGQVVPSDYVAVPRIPANLFGPIAASCLIWRGGLDTGGYGVLRIDGRRELAHRAVYRQTRSSIPEGLEILHLCNRRSCVQPAHLYTGSQAANNRDRELRFGDNQKKGLPLVIHTMNHWRNRGYPIPDVEHDTGILEEAPLAEARRMFGETEQWYARAWEAAEHAWDDPPEQPKQSMMPGMEAPAPTHECRFEIPAGGVRICSVCGESPNAAKWRELKNMMKCHDARGGSSYVAHFPIIKEWPPTSVHCVRCECESALGTGEQHMDVIIENDHWFDETNVQYGSLVSSGPYTGMVRQCFVSPRTSDGSPLAWDVYLDSDEGVEVLVTNGGRFLIQN